MITSFSFWVAALAVLTAYLCLSVWLRLWLRYRAWERTERTRLRALDDEFPPRAFDTAAIFPRMERIRRDYISPARLRRPPALFRTELLEATRRLVMRLGYFRREGLGLGLCNGELKNPPR